MNNDEFKKILEPLNGKFVEVTNYNMLRPDFEYSKSMTKLELQFDPTADVADPVDTEEKRMLLLAKRREYHAQRKELINSQKRALYDKAKRTKTINTDE